MDIARDELSKKLDEISVEKLQVLSHRPILVEHVNLNIGCLLYNNFWTENISIETRTSDCMCFSFWFAK